MICETAVMDDRRRPWGNAAQNLRRSAGGLALIVAMVCTAAAPVFGHGDVMRIGSSQAGGGQIVIEPEFDFGTDVFHVPLTNQGATTSLYSSIFPSFAWILEPGAGIIPLDEEVSIVFTVAAPISAGASVRVGGRNLDEAGETATLGSFENDPEAHVHPEWRLLLPNGVIGEYQVSFRLSATGFTDSPIYTLLITNAEASPTPTATATTSVTESPSATPTTTDPATATPTATSNATDPPTPSVTATPSATATASATPTHTSAAPACPGDCDGNGVVSIAELVRAVGLASRGGTVGCAAADVDGNGSISIDELIRAVRSALEGCAPQ